MLTGRRQFDFFRCWLSWSHNL